MYSRANCSPKVRQVWVSTRIADSSRFAFKGHHGRYLSIDKFGILSAITEAISPEEEITPVHQSDTTRLWGLQTVRDKFISAEEIPGKDVIIRGDAETIAFGENWGIRMQRRFKKKNTKSDGKEIKDKISRKDLEKLYAPLFCCKFPSWSACVDFDQRRCFLAI